MSNYGTKIKTRYPFIYFDNININSLDDIKYKLSEYRKKLKEYEGELLSLSMSTPKDIYDSKNYDNPFDYIKEKFNEIYNNIYETISIINELEMAENIVDEWTYSCYESEKELYDDFNDPSLQAFIKDNFVEIKRDLSKSFIFAPPDDDVQEVFDRSLKNIHFNDKNIKFISDKYIIIFDNKIYVDYDDQFIFKSKEAALKVFKNKLNINILDYLNKDFYEQHPSFYKSIKEKLNDNDKKDFDELVNKIILHKENLDLNYFNSLEKLRILFENVIWSYFDKKLKIITISDLVKSVE